MPALIDIARSGFTGIRTTPVVERAIRSYLVNSAIMNLMSFKNIGMASNIGNLQVTYKMTSSPGTAGNRKIGEEYTPDNQVSTPVTVGLKAIGGAFSTDRILGRAFPGGSAGMDVWTEEQVALKLDAIANGFALKFVKGSATTDADDFDGLSVYLAANSGQVNATPYDIVGGLTDAEVIKTEKHLNLSINSIRRGVKPNRIITTLTGKALLQTLNAIRQRAVNTVRVNDADYDMYMGIPIVDLSDDCFPTTDLTDDKIPVYFIYVSDTDGIFTAVPADGKIVDIGLPKLDSGLVVNPGFCEMWSAPIFQHYKVASKCFITESAAV